MNPTNHAAFRAARDLLLALADDHDAAYARFRWPRFTHFNWALDWFDPIARGNPRPALRVVGVGTDTTLSYAELAERSDRVAGWLRERGVHRGDRLLVLLDNRVEVWEVLLAAVKLGAVVVPTYPSVSDVELADRLRRAAVSAVVTSDARTGRVDRAARRSARPLVRVAVGAPVAGWLPYADAYAAPAGFTPDRPTGADDPLLLYFTSGTTSRPKLALHTHTSYPVGHLSGLYWSGLRPGDLHLNVAAPGWAKHAWSSFFVPFAAEATVLAADLPDGSVQPVLDALRRHRPTTFCAPPTVWRLLAGSDLDRHRPPALRAAGSVGEPLNPEVITRVRHAWGITVRDGYGQTETTAQIGTTPGLPVRPGAMGRPLPGYRIVLLDPRTGARADEGEICVDLADRPAGMMAGYLDDAGRLDAARNTAAFAGGVYHTGDIARRDADGYLTYVGRADDVFKSHNHRVSPFELESVLLTHPDVAAAAVVPVPDPAAGQVPKAFVELAPGRPASAGVAAGILAYSRRRLAAHEWIGRLEFRTLPTTTSGKIRRAELRALAPGASEYRAADLLGPARVR